MEKERKSLLKAREKEKNNRTDVLLSNSANDRVSSSYLNQYIYFWFTRLNYWLSWLVQHKIGFVLSILGIDNKNKYKVT